MVKSTSDNSVSSLAQIFAFGRTLSLGEIFPGLLGARKEWYGRSGENRLLITAHAIWPRSDARTFPTDLKIDNFFRIEQRKTKRQATGCAIFRCDHHKSVFNIRIGKRAFLFCIIYRSRDCTRQ
jgi:hypothetical protein